MAITNTIERRVQTGLTTTSSLWPKHVQLPAIEELMHVLNALSAVTTCEFRGVMYDNLRVRQVTLYNDEYYKIAIGLYTIIRSEAPDQILIINTDYKPNITDIDKDVIITTSGVLTIY